MEKQIKGDKIELEKRGLSENKPNKPLNEVKPTAGTVASHDQQLSRIMSDLWLSPKKENDHQGEIEKFVKAMNGKLVQAEKQLASLRSQQEALLGVRLHVDTNMLDSVKDFNLEYAITSENIQRQKDEITKMLNPHERLESIAQEQNQLFMELKNNKEKSEIGKNLTNLAQEEKKLLNIDEDDIKKCKAQAIRLQLLLEATSRYEKDLRERVNTLEEQRNNTDKVIGDLENCHQEILVRSNGTVELNRLTSIVLELKERANKYKKIFSKEIQKIHESLKEARSQLGNLDHTYLLREQRHEERNLDPNLIRGKKEELCGIACARMLLSDEDSNFLTSKKRGEVIDQFKKLQGGLDIDESMGVAMSHVGEVLKAFKNPIEYEFHTEITQGELRNALRQRDKGEKPISLIVGIDRPNNPYNSSHSIIIKNGGTDENGVQWLEVRDPGNGMAYRLRMYDFLEVWKQNGLLPAAPDGES